MLGPRSDIVPCTRYVKLSTTRSPYTYNSKPPWALLGVGGSTHRVSSPQGVTSGAASRPTRADMRRFSSAGAARHSWGVSGSSMYPVTAAATTGQAGVPLRDLCAAGVSAPRRLGW